MIKVFSQDKILCFIDSQKLYVADADSILVSIQSQDEMRLLYDELVTKNNLTKIYFYNTDEKVLFSYFTSLFKKIEEAGGLVKNNGLVFLLLLVLKLLLNCTFPLRLVNAILPAPS